MIAKNYRSNKHLTLVDRERIEDSLKVGSSRSTIAKSLGKEKSTICKEVKNRRELYVAPYRNTSGVSDCVSMEHCNLKFCTKPCEKYTKIYCARRDRLVGVCNGCSTFSTCNLTRYIYRAKQSQNEYRETLTDSRVGVDLTTAQAKVLGDKILPLLKQGHSPYAICQILDLDICEKSIYNYIRMGVFDISGVNLFHLRSTVNRKQLKKKYTYKPRENRAYLKNRTYKDFEKYVSDHPSLSIVEMDTVYNDVSNGPFIQTFQLVNYNLMIAIYHKEKTAANMIKGFKSIKESLGDDLFSKVFKICITDRGTEFSGADQFEELGFKLFFCDAMQSSQKPHVENNHRLLRFICPNKQDLYKLGLQSQSDLDLIFSHINSYPREVLNGKSPIEVFEFFNEDADIILVRLKISKIEKKLVILTPNLIKK